MDKDTLLLARKLITTTTISVDTVLSKLDVTQEEYRKHYPETPVTVCLALDVLEAQDQLGMTREQIAKRWSLSQSQLNYALYNDNALEPKEVDNSLKACVIRSLRADRMRTQTDIAEAHGVSQSYVHNIAKENGLLRKRKKRVELTEDQWLVIYRMIDEGASIESLAKAHGVARDTLYKKLRMREGA